MADTPKPTTQPLAAGLSTSEGKLTAATIGVTLLVGLLGSVVALLQASHPATPLANLLVFTALSVLPLGIAALQASRWAVARTVLKTDATKNGLAANIPEVVAAVAGLFGKSLPSAAAPAPLTDPATAKTPADGTPAARFP